MEYEVQLTDIFKAFVQCFHKHLKQEGCDLSTAVSPLFDIIITLEGKTNVESPSGCVLYWINTGGQCWEQILLFHIKLHANTAANEKVVTSRVDQYKL